MNARDLSLKTTPTPRTKPVYPVLVQYAWERTGEDLKRRLAIESLEAMAQAFPDEAQWQYAANALRVKP